MKFVKSYFELISKSFKAITLVRKLTMEECDFLPQIIDFIMGIFFPSENRGD